MFTTTEYFKRRPLSCDATALGVFVRKLLRKSFGPVTVGDDYRIRTNRQLYELFNNMYVAKGINIQRSR